ncbi:MAG: hypothetical protein EAZ30_04875 [Betaproteobacteria bacterium]|nr:MAG: hypothetical protein EAZ43_05000 [Betaproteobacteria bacterium]TAG49062.1 MAG: hypothetical protein EAZ30_04875 [Betaproteobacteria bacterium]
MRQSHSVFVTVVASVAAWVGACALISAPALANTPPKNIALISAVGDQFSVVRQKQTVGTNFIDNHTRQTVTVPDQGVNYAVLRGLDRALAIEHPQSNRVFLTLAPEETPTTVLPQDREAYVYKRAVSLIESMPQRKDWDQIVLVTPKWLLSARSGMGSKLTGVGLYVQPLEGGSISVDGSNFESEIGLSLGDDVETPNKDQVRSKTYLAPFFYATVTTLDAKTMKVITQESRHDFRKIYDPESTAIDVQKSIPADKLAGMIDRFMETAAFRSMTKQSSSVEIGPVRTLPDAPKK